MTSVANSLSCQLLCASVCTYSIDQTGSFDEQACATYYQAAGYISTPVALVAGEDNIDACLIGTVAGPAINGGSAVVLAFRGTLPWTGPDKVQSFIDWMNDFNAAPSTVPGIRGKVHTGFWGSLTGLWPSALAEIKAQMNTGGKVLPLYITGHSKGGALASLAAATCDLVEGITPVGVYTYASPMTGDATFAAAYNALSFPDTRYEYTDDIVPHLPLNPLVADLFSWLPYVGQYFAEAAKWAYAAVGTLQFIDWSGNIIGDYPLLGYERFMSIVELMAQLDFSVIAGDHTAACGGGYMTHICPTGVCGPTTTAPVILATEGERPLEAWRRARLQQIQRVAQRP